MSKTKTIEEIRREIEEFVKEREAYDVYRFGGKAKKPRDMKWFKKPGLLRRDRPNE